MGSLSRYSALERFNEAFGERFRLHFEKELLGLSIVEMSDLVLDYHKKSNISLSNGSVIEVHFGWTSEEEEFKQEEILEEGEMTRKEYFNEFLKDKTIISITTGFERDDEFYVFLLVDEGGTCLEIPIGFDSESNEYHGDEEIVSKVEFEIFRERS